MEKQDGKNTITFTYRSASGEEHTMTYRNYMMPDLADFRELCGKFAMLIGFPSKSVEEYFYEE